MYGPFVLKFKLGNSIRFGNVTRGFLHQTRGENDLFSYELVGSGFFTHEFLIHAKNHMNNGKMTYSPMNELFPAISHTNF